MPAAMIGLMVGGAVLQTVGQIRAGNAARNIGEANAALAEQQARDAIVRGKEDEQALRTSMKGLIGSQRAGFASQNVDVTQGSAVDVQADVAFLGELDALRIRTNAQREALGYQAEANIQRQAGQNAQSASRWQAAGTILGTATSAMQARYGFGGSAGAPPVGRNPVNPSAGVPPVWLSF